MKWVYEVKVKCNRNRQWNIQPYSYQVIELIGKKVQIYETEVNGRQAFMIVVDDKEEGCTNYTNG